MGWKGKNKERFSWHWDLICCRPLFSLTRLFRVLGEKRQCFLVAVHSPYYISVNFYLSSYAKLLVRHIIIYFSYLPNSILL